MCHADLFASRYIYTNSIFLTCLISIQFMLFDVFKQGVSKLRSENSYYYFALAEMLDNVLDYMYRLSFPFNSVWAILC